MIINKSQIIIKYWRNTANYKIYIRLYLLKLPACGFVGPKKQHQSMLNMKYNTPI